ncbi:MAG: SpoIIE family protein phosphatase [Clostridiales bacterium]|nr:SpoIIE family protein phosphatase [Clostridiales bacterium]
MKFGLGKKLTALIVALGIVLGATAVVISYRTYSDSMMDYYTLLGTNLTRTLASQLDADALERYYETGETDEGYYETQDFIQSLVENNQVEYLYVVRPNGTGVTFLFDSDMETSTSGEYEEGGYCALGSYVELVGDFAANLDKLLAGEEVEPIIQNDESYGWMMTAMTPVRTEDGVMVAYVMADISMNDAMNTRQTFLILLSAVMALLTVVFILVFLLILRRQVLTPIDQLTQATGAFIQNNEQELLQGTAAVNVPEIHTGDEVELLAAAFRKMEEDMISYIRSLLEVTAEKERIGAELNVATQIQADMLPRIFPAFPERKEFDIYATMEPAKEVGGDFYDFFLVDADHLAVVVADVSGKGVPAALFMVIAKTLIKNHAQNREKLEDVFTHTNEQLCEGNDAGLFVTAWIGLLEISTGAFTYVNAGHNPPLLKRVDGNYEWMKARSGFVLAGMEGARYHELTDHLDPGDKLFLYTDGVTEAANSAEELFGSERLQAALNQRIDLPPQKLLTELKQSIDDFAGDAEQFDDITMVSLEYKGARGAENV